MFERARRRRPSNDERHHHVREHDDVPERDDGERFVLIHGYESVYVELSRAYPAFSMTVIGFSFDSTTSRVITHSRIFF